MNAQDTGNLSVKQSEPWDIAKLEMIEVTFEGHETVDVEPVGS